MLEIKSKQTCEGCLSAVFEDGKLMVCCPDSIYSNCYEVDNEQTDMFGFPI